MNREAGSKFAVAYCFRCRWYKYADNKHTCFHADTNVVDVVQGGNSMKHCDPYYQRSEGACGPPGLNWEEKEPTT